MELAIAEILAYTNICPFNLFSDPVLVCLALLVPQRQIGQIVVIIVDIHTVRRDLIVKPYDAIDVVAL